jgi:hypothetical protein
VNDYDGNMALSGLGGGYKTLKNVVRCFHGLGRFARSQAGRLVTGPAQNQATGGHGDKCVERKTHLVNDDLNPASWIQIVVSHAPAARGWRRFMMQRLAGGHAQRGGCQRNRAAQRLGLQAA